jgi:hypothetical protein
MLNFFKSYEPYFNLVYLVLAIGLSIPLLQITEIDAESFSLIPWQSIPKIFLIIGCSLLIWIGALLSNSVFGSRDFHSISSGMPGLIFVLYSSTIMLGLCKPWALLASVLLLSGLWFQTMIFRQNDVRKDCFNAAVCYGIASLIYFPLAILLIAQVIGLTQSRTFVWREYLMCVMGYALPWAWMIALGWLMKFSVVDVLVFDHLTSSGTNLTPAFSPWVVLLGWGAASLIGSFARSTNAARNTKSISLRFSAGVVLAIILGEIIGAQGPYELMAIPMALIIPFLVLNSKSEARSWLIAAIMISGIVAAYFL